MELNKYEKKGMRLVSEKEQEFILRTPEINISKMLKVIGILLVIVFLALGLFVGFMSESLYVGIGIFIGGVLFAFIVVGGTLFANNSIRKKAEVGNLYVYDGVYKIKSKKEELYLIKNGQLSKVFQGRYGAPRWQVREEIKETADVIAIPVSDTYWLYKKR